MSETKFTRGPWHAAANFVRDEHDHDLAECNRIRRWMPPYKTMSSEELLANANVMAASPELYAIADAVDAYVHSGETCPLCSESPHHPYCAVPVTLRKARGE